MQNSKILKGAIFSKFLNNHSNANELHKIIEEESNEGQSNMESAKNIQFNFLTNIKSYVNFTFISILVTKMLV